MKRALRLRSGQAPPRGLERNAAVVLGCIGAVEDIALLTRALDHEEPLVREHAALVLGRIDASAGQATARDRLGTAEGPDVRAELPAVHAAEHPAASHRGA